MNFDPKIVGDPDEARRMEAIFNSIFIADRFLHPEHYDE